MKRGIIAIAVFALLKDEPTKYPSPSPEQL